MLAYPLHMLSVQSKVCTLIQKRPSPSLASAHSILSLRYFSIFRDESINPMKDSEIINPPRYAPPVFDRPAASIEGVQLPPSVKNSGQLGKIVPELSVAQALTSASSEEAHATRPVQRQEISSESNAKFQQVYYTAKKRGVSFNFFLFPRISKFIDPILFFLQGQWVVFAVFFAFFLLVSLFSKPKKREIDETIPDELRKLGKEAKSTKRDTTTTTVNKKDKATTPKVIVDTIEIRLIYCDVQRKRPRQKK